MRRYALGEERGLLFSNKVASMSVGDAKMTCLNSKKSLDHGASVGDDGDLKRVDNNVQARLQAQYDLGGGVQESRNVDLLYKQIQPKIMDNNLDLGADVGHQVGRGGQRTSGRRRP